MCLTQGTFVKYHHRIEPEKSLNCLGKKDVDSVPVLNVDFFMVEDRLYMITQRYVPAYIYTFEK